MPNQLTTEQFILLMQRYIENRHSEQDFDKLVELIDDPYFQMIANDLIEGRMQQKAKEVYTLDEATKTRLHELLSGILDNEGNEEHKPRTISIFKRYRYAAAAAVILFIAGASWFFLNQQTRPASESVQTAQVEVKAPDRNKATLTLSNGHVVDLDTVQNGTLIAGIARKTEDGRIIIESNNSNIQSNIQFITAHNPRNSKSLSVTLPDRTEVLLNAETDLQYPTAFTGKTRTVTLNGEADFKVVHNAAQPFQVIAGDQTIEDIGTEFNVKAYKDGNSVATTLIEGEVRINNQVNLKPGQQYANGKVTRANMEEVLAWIKGGFYLEGREFGEVANELGRWYDVEVEFATEKAKHSVLFGGKMGRNLTLNQAVKVLQQMNVKCTLEGKKLIVE